jgi:ABC-2 type transport system ATP-binding protein
MEQCLEARAVRKQFGAVRAVDGVSFAVRRGEIFALLGPNGAGKTTLVRMLMGILRPDAGTVSYALSDPPPVWPAPSELGYLPEDRGLYRDLPILRTLSYFGSLRGMERKAAERAAVEWLERLELRDRARERLDRLSKGNQQKVQFAAAVLHRPAFAVLDEPFSGFDPLNQELFLQLVRQLRDNGMTILLSAHQMNLVERLADRMLLMNRGREVLNGTLAEIRRQAQAGSRLRLKVAGSADLAPLERHPAVRSVERGAEDEVCLLTHEGANLSDLLVVAGSTLTITEVLSERLSLHDIYVQTVGGDAVASEEQEVYA